MVETVSPGASVLLRMKSIPEKRSLKGDILIFVHLAGFSPGGMFSRSLQIPSGLATIWVLIACRA